MMKLVIKGQIRSRLDGPKGSVTMPPKIVDDDISAEVVNLLVEEAKSFIVTALGTHESLKPIIAIEFKSLG